MSKVKFTYNLVGNAWKPMLKLKQFAACFSKFLFVRWLLMISHGASLVVQFSVLKINREVVAKHVRHHVVVKTLNLLVYYGLTANLLLLTLYQV